MGFVVATALFLLMSVPVFGVAGVSHSMAEITGLDTNLNTIPDKAEGLHDSTQADQTLTPNEIQKRLVQPQCNPGETLTGIGADGSPGCVTTWTYQNPFLYYLGTIGIGTNTPNTLYTLDVTGDINANQLCITGTCINNWGAVIDTSGSGTSGHLARWTDTTTLGDSTIQDDGTNIGIGTPPTSTRLTISGGIHTDTITTTNTIDAQSYTQEGSTTLTNDISGNAATATSVPWIGISNIPAGFADGTDNVDDADADPTNEIQDIIPNQGITRDTNNNFGLTDTCNNGEILKRSGTTWTCAPDQTGITVETQNIFTTITTLAGTSPVADSPTDTLTLTPGGIITITGNAATDTITISATETYTAVEDQVDSISEWQSACTGCVRTNDISAGTYGISISGNAASVPWNGISNIPAGFADGTDNVDDADADPTNEIQNTIPNQGITRDTNNNFGLTDTCNNGEILKRSGTTWTCAPDDSGVGVENDPEVDTLTANNICRTNAGGTAIDCNLGTTLPITSGGTGTTTGSITGTGALTFAAGGANQNININPTGTGTVTTTGKIVTTASTTARASLNIPHGTAPTTPTNGDIWTTTTGLFARINGATIGPYGTVTNIATGPGLSGGPITTTGTISLANTAVTPGSYGSTTEVSTITIDAQGRITAASNTPIAIDTTAITGGTLPITRGGTGTTTGSITAPASTDLTFTAGTGNQNININPTGTGAVSIGGRATITGNLAVDTDTLFVDSANNGVGIGTQSPGTNRLRIIGDSAASLPRVEIRRDNIADDENLDVTLRLANDAYNQYWDIMMPALSNDLHFLDGGAGGGIKMVIKDATGNVGIGTTDPSAELDVAGDIAINNKIMLSQDGGNSDVAHINGGDSYSRIKSHGILNVVGESTIGTGYANTNPPTNGLLVQGNVGIGTASTTVTVPLTVQANGATIRLQGPSSGQHNYIEYYTDGSGGARSGWIGYGADGTSILSITNQKTTGHIDISPGSNGFARVPLLQLLSTAPPSCTASANVGVINLETTTGASGSSTYRICMKTGPSTYGWHTLQSYAWGVSDVHAKKDIQDIDSPLLKIQEINGITYHFKDETQETPHSGFIAQDIEKVFPNAVREDPEGMKYLDYNTLNPQIQALLVESVKELKQEKDQEIAQLHEENKQLKAALCKHLGEFCEAQ